MQSNLTSFLNDKLRMVKMVNLRFMLKNKINTIKIKTLF